MVDTVIIDIIILFTLILSIIFIAIILFKAWDVSNPPPIGVVDDGFLSVCTQSECGDGFICDGSTFTCKLVEGSHCTNQSDCSIGLICSGLCVTGSTGTLDNFCPCLEGLSCVSEIDGSTVCKLDAGQNCKSDADCTSNFCGEDNTCTAGNPVAFPCSDNRECADGNCSLGFCQPLNTTSGTLGSRCAESCVTFKGAECISTIEVPLACVCDQPNQAGVCISSNQGINSPCSLDSPCVTGLECLREGLTGPTGPTGPCQKDDSFCLCLFPYDDPNIAPCITGMESIGTKCLNTIGISCNSGTQCSSTICNGPSVINTYRFFTSDAIDLRTRYPSATTTELKSFGGPTGLIKPHKMLATSDGDVDTIYLVDKLQGLLKIIYNPIKDEIIEDWKVLIPLTMNLQAGTGTLQDVTFNETMFLVAFTEVNGIEQFDTVYNWDGDSTFTAFNPTPGVGFTGTQYSTSDAPLEVEYISISVNNDISMGNDVLIADTGTNFIKSSLVTKYSIGVVKGGSMDGTLMTGVTGPSTFYYDQIENPLGTGPPICPENNTNSPIQCPSVDNIAFSSKFINSSGDPLTFEQILQFSGNIAGIVLPLDPYYNLDYRVFDFSIFSNSEPAIGITGMQSSSIAMLTAAYDNGVFLEYVVALSDGGISTLFPLKFGTPAKCLSTENSFYVLNISSCI